MTQREVRRAGGLRPAEARCESPDTGPLPRSHEWDGRWATWTVPSPPELPRCRSCSSRLDEGLTGVGLGGHTDGFEVSVAEGPAGPRTRPCSPPTSSCAPGRRAGRRRTRRRTRSTRWRQTRASPAGTGGRRGRRQPALPGDGRGDASCGTRTACRSSPTPSTPSWSRPYSPRARATRGTYPSNSPWCGRAAGTRGRVIVCTLGHRVAGLRVPQTAAIVDRARVPSGPTGGPPGARRHVRQGHRTGC